MDSKRPSEVPGDYEELGDEIWHKELACWSNEWGFVSLHRCIEGPPNAKAFRAYFWVNGDGGEDTELEAKTLDAAMNEVEQNYVAEDCVLTRFEDGLPESDRRV